MVIVAGEASGDLHAAKVLEALGELMPGLTASGVGGPALERGGARLMFRAEDLALVGISEVFGKLGQIWRALTGMRRHLRQERPELLILVDFPDFNLRLAKTAKSLGIKVLYYVSPQVWAWRQKRALRMSKLVDHLAVVFPFEKVFYKAVAPELPVTFVGHPLLDEEEAWGGRAREPLPAVPEGAELVGLLPGSRVSEITRLLPLLLKAAKLMRQERQGLHFVLPVAPGLDRAIMDPYLDADPLPGLTVLPGRAAQVMAQARVLLVASGTATLQAALAGAPMVVVYKTGGFNYALGRRLIKVEHIAMPNLIVGHGLVPELIQHEATPQAVCARALALMDDGPDRRAMIDGLGEVRRKLGGPGASRRVGELARTLIEGNSV